MDLDELAADIDWPDREAARAAQQRWDALTKPAGSLGRLEELGTWWCSVRGACPAPPPADPVLLLVAGDHGVAREAGTSAYPPEVTAQMVRAFLRGEAAANALARSASARVRVVDAGVDADPDYAADLAPGVADRRIRRGSGSIDREDAMTLAEAERAVALGVALVDDEVDAGADLLLLGDMGIGNTTVSAVIISLLAPGDVVSLVGRGTGIDDATWMRKCAAARDAVRRGRPDKGAPLELLASVGSPDLAVMVGALLRAAGRRTPVILDGPLTSAAALIAHRIAYKSRDWWQASHLSVEPAHAAAFARLDLAPLLDLKMRLGEGTGALLALPLLRAAAATLQEMRTFEELGVTQVERPPTRPRP